MDGFFTITARLKENERYPVSQTWVSRVVEERFGELGRATPGSPVSARMVSEFEYLPANWILA